jgi:hypothetical protein
MSAPESSDRDAQYAGPVKGSTPTDDSDLHGNGDNHYARSSPAIDTEGIISDRYTVNGPSGGPAGPYFTNPAALPITRTATAPAPTRAASKTQPTP